jgi:peptide chain release factor 3
VFKIQANMDPKHRDRIAFVRLSSGHFKRGAKLLHVRSGKTLTISNPQLFMAQDRERAEEAWPGDIVGIPNYGNLRIGDALTDGETLHFTGIPSFAPELLQTVRPEDPLKAKHLGRALQQLAEEGAASVFKPRFGMDWIVGVVGALQFEVLADRIRTEYEVAVRFERAELYTARRVTCADPAELKRFLDANRASIADDHDGAPVFLARNAWHLNRTIDDNPKITFLKTRELVQ